MNPILVSFGVGALVGTTWRPIARTVIRGGLVGSRKAKVALAVTQQRIRQLKQREVPPSEAVVEVEGTELAESREATANGVSASGSGRRRAAKKVVPSRAPRKGDAPRSEPPDSGRAGKRRAAKPSAAGASGPVAPRDKE